MSVSVSQHTAASTLTHRHTHSQIASNSAQKECAADPNPSRAVLTRVVARPGAVHGDFELRVRSWNATFVGLHSSRIGVYAF